MKRSAIAMIFCSVIVSTVTRKLAADAELGRQPSSKPAVLGLGQEFDDHHVGFDLAGQQFASEPGGGGIPRAAPGQVVSHSIVVDDAVLAKQMANRDGKLLLYNFTGFNCGSCWILVERSFKDEAVHDTRRAHVVEARLHTDSQGDVSDAQFDRNGASRLCAHRVLPVATACWDSVTRR